MAGIGHEADSSRPRDVSPGRAARAAERSLLAGQRPLLVSSRLEDPEQELQFTEGTLLTLRGGEAALKVSDDAIYLAVSVRNVGTGLAVLPGSPGGGVGGLTGG